MSSPRKFAAIRRKESFKRYSSAIDVVEEWLYRSTEVHHALVSFVWEKRLLSVGHPPTEADLTECSHAVQDAHQQFCELFETMLNSFLASRNVRVEELEAVMQLAKEEEEAEGENIHRWTNIVDLQIFLILLYQSSLHDSLTPDAVDSIFHSAVDCIRKDERAARDHHRRVAAIEPLLMRWAPMKFEEVLDVLEKSSKEFPPNLGKARLKELMRWRLKITNKVMSPSGVYVDPPPNEEEWLGYLTAYVSNMDITRLEAFVAFVDTFASSQGGEEGDSVKQRRAAWQCFSSFDWRRKGLVELQWVANTIGSLTVPKQEKPLFQNHERSLRKLILKHKAERVAEDGPKEASFSHVNLSAFFSLTSWLYEDCDLIHDKFRTPILFYNALSKEAMAQRRGR